MVLKHLDKKEGNWGKMLSASWKRMKLMEHPVAKSLVQKGFEAIPFKRTYHELPFLKLTVRT